MSKNQTHAFLVASIMLAVASMSHAALYSVVAEGDGRTYTVIDADTFTTTAGPGNTVGVVSPGTPWASASTSNTDGLWRDRLHNAFFGFTIPGSAGNLYELGSSDRTAAPELKTTVTGLAPGQYDVFLVYVMRDDGNADSGGLTADLGAPATTVHRHNTPGVIPGLNGTNVWDVAFSQIGTTAAGATGFDANVKGTTTTNRNDYIGLAYIPVVNTPDLKIDFGNSKGTGGGPGGIQSGFQAFEFIETAGGTPALTRLFHTDFGDINVTVDGYTHFRDYTAVTGTFAAQSDLLSDMVLRNADGTLSIELDGLSSGEYEIEFYHHSTQFGGGGFDIMLDGVLVASAVPTSDGTNPSSISTTLFNFSNLDGDALFEFVGGTPGDHLAINGFNLRRLPTVPEPASAALLLLGGVAMLQRRRRQA